jgi:hypothetical protein
MLISVSPRALTRRMSLSCRATRVVAVRYIGVMESLEDTHVDWLMQLMRVELEGPRSAALPVGRHDHLHCKAESIAVACTATEPTLLLSYLTARHMFKASS